jgi:hypothetical protein
MSHPTPDDSVIDGPARPGASRRRSLAKLLIGVLAIVAAVLVIVWLPPSGDVETEVRETLVEFEIAGEAAWPKDAAVGLPLTAAQQHTLALTLRTKVGRYAADEALEEYDAEGAARAFAEASEADPKSVVVRWKGEVVYFDFVRHTLPTGLIVRAGVLKAHRLGRVNATVNRVFGSRWVWAGGAAIKEYTLLQVDGRWRVVDAEHWGVCDAEGNDVVEGRQAF